jgi:hypothetical protein
LDALSALLEPLDAAQREQLADLLRAMLQGQPRERGEARTTCRYCIHEVCTGPDCPVGRSADGRPG